MKCTDAGACFFHPKNGTLSSSSLSSALSGRACLTDGVAYLSKAFFHSKSELC